VKKFFLAIGLVAGGLAAFAQNDIVQMEYFFDSDPGFGNGTPISITSGPTQDVDLTIGTTSLSVGFHTLVIRAKEQSGTWGVPEYRVIYVAPGTIAEDATIGNVEYYIDNDPGPGNGTFIPIFTSFPHSVDLFHSIPTGSLSTGFHMLHVRAQDGDGNWGIPDSKPFYVVQGGVTSTTNIIQLEYFFDTDPGIGAATPVTFTGGAQIDIPLLIGTTALSDGFHSIHIRAKDVDGQWSIFEKRTFYIDQFTQISSLEYYIDSDPGEGNGTNIAVTPAGEIDEVISIPTTSIANGSHTLGVRAARSDGSWGSTTTATFSVKEPQTITFGSISPVTYGVAPFTLTGTSSSGLPLTYVSSNPLVATISGSTVTVVGAGTTVITASQPGDGSYAPATDTPQSLVVNKANQTITFGALPTKRADDPSFVLGASSTSSLTISYSSSNLSVATVSGNTVTLVGAGTTNITASQAGNGNYNAATDAVQALLVEPANNVPSLSSGSPTAFFATGPLVINNTIVVTDADDVLASATISITAGFQSAEDELLFDPQNGISGSYNNATGVLLISGTGSASNYQSAFRSIRYNNLSTSPNTDDRTITFVLSDGIDDSGQITTIITINKPPVIEAPQKDATAGGNVAFRISDIFSDPDDNLDANSLSVTSKAGAMITISGDFITANYATIPDYEGTDELTMSICDLASKCQTQVVAVEIGADIELFNGISVNADNMNDFMRIKFLPPDSRVVIFNRWGDVVYENNQYDSTDPAKRFEGVGHDGDVLATGTYFYKITLPDKRERKGYIYIKR
jgi:hypothetical protein